jgi:hypothetical protein
MVVFMVKITIVFTTGKSKPIKPEEPIVQAVHRYGYSERGCSRLSRSALRYGQPPGKQAMKKEAWLDPD